MSAMHSKRDSRARSTRGLRVSLLLAVLALMVPARAYSQAPSFPKQFGTSATATWISVARGDAYSGSGARVPMYDAETGVAVNFPYSGAAPVCGLAVGADGRVLNYDCFDHLESLSPAASLLWNITIADLTAGEQWGDGGVALDANGNVYYVVNQSVPGYNAGRFTVETGHGTGSGGPWLGDHGQGVAVDAGGRVYVAEPWTNRIAVFAPNASQIPGAEPAFGVLPAVARASSTSLRALRWILWVACT